MLQPESRACFRRLLDQGWIDAVRTRHPDQPMYRFWDYKRDRWQRDAGLRIDFVLLNKIAAERLIDAGVDRVSAARRVPAIMRLLGSPCAESELPTGGPADPLGRGIENIGQHLLIRSSAPCRNMKRMIGVRDHHERCTFPKLPGDLLNERGVRQNVAGPLQEQHGIRISNRCCPRIVEGLFAGCRGTSRKACLARRTVRSPLVPAMSSVRQMTCRRRREPGQEFGVRPR